VNPVALGRLLVSYSSTARSLRLRLASRRPAGPLWAAEPERPSRGVAQFGSASRGSGRSHGRLLDERDVGAWRSLVARFHGVEEVARSNRVAPTRIAILELIDSFREHVPPGRKAARSNRVAPTRFFQTLLQTNRQQRPPKKRNPAAGTEPGRSDARATRPR
jgi:hypothetical protein